MSGLRQTHGHRLLLDGLNLVAEPGLITVVLGPSGSGKSTLMRILAGFETLQAGIIELDDRSIGRMPAHRRRFGVVQQPDLLFPHLDVAENVAFPLSVRHTSRAGRARLVATTLEQLQLGHAADLLPRALTPAEYQRALLARATIFAPRLLLLDEPFSDQEPAARATLIASLRRIHELLGTTTLIATRSGTDAVAAADRLAVLRAGSLEQYGTPLEVFDRPRNAYVAAQLGETNSLPGLVEKVDDDLAIIRLACGPTVEALRGKTLQAGDACVLTLRPDRIAIAPLAAAEMGERAIDATVLEVQFLGEIYRLRLLIGSGAELVVRRPSGAGLRRLGVGAAASIAWQSHHAFAFQVEEARFEP